MFTLSSVQFVLLIAAIGLTVLEIALFVLSCLKFKKRALLVKLLVAKVKAGESISQTDFDSLSKYDQNFLKSLEGFQLGD